MLLSRLQVALVGATVFPGGYLAVTMAVTWRLPGGYQSWRSAWRLPGGCLAFTFFKKSETVFSTASLLNGIKSSLAVSWRLPLAVIPGGYLAVIRRLLGCHLAVTWRLHCAYCCCCFSMLWAHTFLLVLTRYTGGRAEQAGNQMG